MEEQPIHDWRMDPPSDKQLVAIANMARALSRLIPEVKTKGEASDLLDEMSKLIGKSLTVQARGLIKPPTDPNKDDEDLNEYWEHNDQREP